MLSNIVTLTGHSRTKYYINHTITSLLTSCRSYTIVCPPVCGDKPRALASGLSPRTGGQPWYNEFILHQCRTCT